MSFKEYPLFSKFCLNFLSSIKFKEDKSENNLEICLKLKFVLNAIFSCISKAEFPAEKLPLLIIQIFFSIFTSSAIIFCSISKFSEN